MIQVILFSLFNCTFLICLYKWKIVPDRFNYYKPKILSWIDWCELCFFFWCGVVEWLLTSVYSTVNWIFFVSTFFHAMCICSLSILLYESYKFLKRLNSDTDATN